MPVTEAERALATDSSPGPGNGGDPARARGRSGLARGIGIAVSIGLPFGVLVSSGALGGHYLDGKWDTAPWLTLAGIGLGSLASFVNMFRVLSWWQRQEPDVAPVRLEPDEELSRDDDATPP